MKNYNVTVNGVTYSVSVEELKEGEATLKIDTTINTSTLNPTSKAEEVKSKDKAEGKASSFLQNDTPSNKTIKAQVAGKITQILVKNGQEIKNGDTVLMIEAMKMEIPVVSEFNGVVSSILVSIGQNAEANASLISLD